MAQRFSAAIKIKKKEERLEPLHYRSPSESPFRSRLPSLPHHGAFPFATKRLH
jgi:hypothetical protein